MSSREEPVAFSEVRRASRYEERYAKVDSLLWGAAPSSLCVRLGHHLNPGAAVLDVGCGEGRNALYLATLGHQVIALDQAASGIAKLQALATASGLRIQALVGDLLTYEVPHAVDAVVAMGVFHYVPAVARRAVLKKYQRATEAGGWHLVSVHVQARNLAQAPGDDGIELFGEPELKELYEQWQVEEFVVKTVTHTDHGPSHQHLVHSVLAQKP